MSQVYHVAQTKTKLSRVNQRFVQHIQIDVATCVMPQFDSEVDEIAAHVSYNSKHHQMS